ncbi:MAG: sigma-70 family RNA polymerase sigma factor [Candidatus Omnitrophica bacterium]|nr:sigma-70 family RNA polymerase sigma factor [Candidatus Omnitrophota bacterium]
MEPRDPDWTLIEQFLAGDTTAFDRLFQAHKSRVINLSFRYVRGREAAEDIAQEVFLKVYDKKVKVDPAAKFTTWLYRVTVNASLDYLRRNKNSPRSLDEEAAPGLGLQSRVEDTRPSARQTVLADEVRRQLTGEIDRLPEKLRLPLVLYQFEELPYQEIAAILGITSKAVERRLYHAREQLRKVLGDLL